MTDLYNSVTSICHAIVGRWCVGRQAAGSTRHKWDLLRHCGCCPPLSRIWTSASCLSSYFSSAREIFWTTSFSSFFSKHNHQRALFRSCKCAPKHDLWWLASFKGKLFHTLFLCALHDAFISWTIQFIPNHGDFVIFYNYLIELWITSFPGLCLLASFANAIHRFGRRANTPFDPPTTVSIFKTKG